MEIRGIKSIKIEKIDDMAIKVVVSMVEDKTVEEDHTFSIECGFTENDMFALALLGTLGYDKVKILTSGIITPRQMKDCMTFYDEEEAEKREADLARQVNEVQDKIRKEAGIE